MKNRISSTLTPVPAASDGRLRAVEGRGEQCGQDLRHADSFSRCEIHQQSPRRLYPACQQTFRTENTCYTRLVNKHSGLRTHCIDRITPHCVVGQVTAARLGDIFSGTRDVSSNYGIALDGTVALYVEEKNRSWCSSSNANDQRAITIECASDPKPPYAFKPIVYDTLVKLCTDICKRNGKKKLLWFGDKTKSLNYSPKSDEMVLTVHRWFCNKSCPGDWMYARMGDLAQKVTAALSGDDAAPAPQPSTKCPYSEPTKDIAFGARGNNVRWLQWQ